MVCSTLHANFRGLEGEGVVITQSVVEQVNGEAAGVEGISEGELFSPDASQNSLCRILVFGEKVRNQLSGHQDRIDKTGRISLPFSRNIKRGPMID